MYALSVLLPMDIKLIGIFILIILVAAFVKVGNFKLLTPSAPITKEATSSAVASPTPSPSATPSATPKATPKVSSTPKPSFTPTPAPVVNNTPPGSGYSVQNVSTDVGVFKVSIISADLNSTKVIVDTASDGDCSNNCPVLPLATYVSRSGAYAGINGSFFCPAEYPSCAGKINSFDTLLMNKNKIYFNSNNNTYSTVPAAIFSSGNARFVSQSLQWGRDTGVDGVIANYPMLVLSDQLVYTEPVNEPKFGAQGSRTFIAAKGANVYIGVVFSATMGESAKVMKAMGMRDALNLDEGGSTVLWSGGYKAGPGRNIPNAVLFVQR